MIFPLIISVMLHLGLGYLIGSTGKEGSYENNSGTSQNMGEKDKHTSIRVPGQVVIKDNKSKQSKKKTKQGSGKDCENYYYGIGVMTEIVHDERGRCKVTEVAKGGPADKANMKPGDTYILVDDERCILRGKNGSVARVKLWRGNSTNPVYIELVRERICTDENGAY